MLEDIHEKLDMMLFQNCPEWREFTDRIWHGQGAERFSSVRKGLVGLQLPFSMCADMRARNKVEGDNCFTASICFWHGRTCGWPFWMVGKDLLDTLLRTDPVGDWSLEHELAPPFPAVFFGLPPKALVCPDGNEVRLIGLSWPGTATDCFGGQAASNLMNMAATAHPFRYLASRPVHGNMLSLNEEVGFRGYGLDVGERGVAPIHEDDPDFVNRLFGLAVQLAAMLNLEPHWVEPSEVLEPHRKSGRPQRTVPWLGRKFDEGLKTMRKHAETNPTGRVMPTHWRRGHWHTYLHGPGKTLRKKLRIPWTMVNDPAKKETE